MNIRRFLEQFRHDPLVSSSLLQEWQIVLEEALDVPSRKYEHASLFGRLVKEWLEEARDLTLAPTRSEDTERNDSSQVDRNARIEMHDQRKEWESIVFAEDSKSDPTAVEAYLTSLFGSTSQAKRMVKSPLEALRESMSSFRLGQLDAVDLKTCIVGVLKTDLLSEAKRKTLAEFLENTMVLEEMVDVLNIQLDGLESWSWGDGPIPVEVRRSLNGKYRVYMDEEILQALLLHFIGMRWGVHLKAVFLVFFNSGLWKQSTRCTMDRQRRQNLLGRDYGTGKNVRNERRDRYMREFFLSQLPASFGSTSDNYDDNSGTGPVESRSPTAMKQSILHLISTEALLNSRLHSSFTALQSDFKWFGPSLPNATIMAVLHFFGVSDKWLKSFQ